VDDRNALGQILDALARISEDMPVIFPVHPRTKKNIEEFDQLKLINDSNIKLLPPMPYVDFLKLWKDASLVLTDSGGLQEETTALGQEGRSPGNQGWQVDPVIEDRRNPAALQRVPWGDEPHRSQAGTSRVRSGAGKTDPIL